jgi:hypothetical protein
VKTRIRRSIRHRASILLVAAAVGLGGAAAPASAEGFFESLFGGFRRHLPAPRPPASPFGDPFAPFGHRRGGEVAAFGHGTIYCVRTCDGRYFPLQRHAGVTPADACRSFCPTAKTMVFSGGRIDTAVAQNGARYAELANAFLYRDRVVDGCTCNGKDRLGLARVDATTDPTLRPGDIVATNEGLVTYSIDGRTKTAEYTPIDSSSSEWARRLAAVKVEPAPAA